MADNEIKSIELLPEQILHYENLTQILQYYDAGVDLTKQGLGKTIFTLKRAQEEGYDLIVICTLTMIDIWQHEAIKYGVNVRCIMTYARLRGQTEHNLSHTLLKRHNSKFTDHDDFLYLCRTNYAETGKKVLLVFDEFQNAKNDNLQSKSCISLAHSIYKVNSQLTDHKNKVMLLSGTASQNISSAGIFAQWLNWAPVGKLYTTNDKVNVIEDKTGFDILVSNCLRVNEIETKKIISDYISPDNIGEIIHRLLVQIIFPCVRSKSDEIDYGVECKISDLFVLLNDSHDIKLHIEGLQYLSNMRLCRKNNSEHGPGTGEALLTKGMMSIEFSKLSSLVRWALRDLTSDNKTKVLLCVWHIDSLNYLAKIFKNWGPLILYGKTSKDSRDIINKFQHDPNYRLFIGNPTVFGQGLGLHDIYGTMPRKMYISASYKTWLVEQTILRIYRLGVKSNSNVFIVYGNSGSGKGEYMLVEKSVRNREIISSYDGRENKNRTTWYEQADGSLIEDTRPISIERTRNTSVSSNIFNPNLSVSTNIEFKIPEPEPSLLRARVQKANLISL